MNSTRSKDFRVLIVYPNLPMMLVPSIAIAIFTRIFKDLGYQVDLFETTHYDTDEINYSENKINYSENRVKILNARKFNVEKDLGISTKRGMLPDFRRKVAEFKPDFMIYSVVEDTFLQTLSMMREIADFDIPHLVGGVFPTMASEVCFAADEINFMAIGEGERTVREAAEAIRLGTSLDDIAGTWRKRPDGTVQKNPMGSLSEMDRVIPDFSLFHSSRFNRPMGGRVFRMMPIESYRGCPYSCTYCNSPTQRKIAMRNKLGKYLRRNSTEFLRDKLRILCDTYQPEFIFFVDDVFLARPRQEIFDFCDMYEEFKLPFYFNTRAEGCDTEIMQRLKEVGCYRIAFGIESGNEQYRQHVLRRKISNKEILRRFEMIADSGIPFSINLIIGMPGETREMVMDTIRLARSVRGYDSVTSFIFTPYHGTPLREAAVENGWLDSDTITKHNTSRSLLEMPPPYLDAEAIDGLMATLPLYCYFPESEWPKIRRAEQFDEEGLRIREEYSDIYTRNFFGETQDSPKIYLNEDGQETNRLHRAPFLETEAHLDPAQLMSLTTPMAGL